MTQKQFDFCKRYNLTENQFFGTDTVGGYLYLSSLTSIPEGFNPTVGGSLDLRSLTSGTPKHNHIDADNYLFSWENEKYIKVDGMFVEVVYKKRNVFKVKKIGEDKIFFVVTDNNGKFSHGDTVKEAKEDLIFKISNRDKSDFEALTIDSVLTFEKAIECYRVITGACSFGTKDFVHNRLNGNKRDKYTIGEMILVTHGEYGNKAFADFFKS